MLTNIKNKDLKTIISSFRPGWKEDAVTELASAMHKELSPCFEPLLLDYIERGEENNYAYKDISVNAIMALRSCDFLTAILLLDEYIKDEISGRALILRR